MLGPSGSGKSSLVLAGLVPALRTGSRAWRRPSSTPGSDPLAALEAKLAEVGDRPAVVVVDQFEEVFTLCPDAAQRQAFLDRLLALARDAAGGPDDAGRLLGRVRPVPRPARAMQAHQELIAPMTPRSCGGDRAAGGGGRPALRGGPGGTILDDVRASRGRCRCCSTRCWSCGSAATGAGCKAEEYRAIGRVQGAIAQTAEAVYDALRRDRSRSRCATSSCA